MVPSGVFVDKPSPGRIRLLRPRPGSYTLADLVYLEARSDRPDVQRFLSDAIREGRIRVRPCPDAPGRVLITRLGTDRGDTLPVRRV